MNPLIEVANAIQLAVAPAFLLTGIGGDIIGHDKSTCSYY